MKILLDTCVYGGVKGELFKKGHDVIWTGDWPEDPGDEEILDFAFVEKRILITLDKDFGALAVLHRHPHVGIIRLVNFPLAQQSGVCLKILEIYKDELDLGSLVTVEPGRIRIRPPVR
jgi:predicted nuclease of predicted toxin-antitoxin system